MFSYKNFVKYTVIYLFFLYFPLSAQLSSFELGGYVKNLSTLFHGDFYNLPLDLGKYQNSTQLRLNLFWYANTNMTFTAQGRTMFIYQDNVQGYNNLLESFSKSSYYFDSKITYLDNPDFTAYTEIDRLNMDWSLGNFETIVGRQRIVWGTCLVWNPTDLFNPFNILNFDYDERPGTDALMLNYYTGAVSQVNIAATPGRSIEQVIYAGRFLFNKWDYDFAILPGWQKKMWRLGFNWTGNLFDGGFRGEILWSKPDKNYNQSIYLLPGYVSRTLKDPYWTIALSYDYTFSSSLYLHTEYLYNGLGVTENAGYRQWEIMQTGELSPARHSVFQEFAYDLTPLLRGDIFIIFNPNDYSFILAPSLSYSLSSNWDAYLLAFISDGKTGSEFGGYPNQYFLRFKYSF